MNVDIIFTETAIQRSADALPSREIGAAVEFHGIVREMEQGRALDGLYYECYESMARHQLTRIFHELGASHPVTEITFVHRLGWVPVGEASMWVRVLSSHRGEAFAFCAAAIDQMKRDVPIWKRSDIAGAK